MKKHRYIIAALSLVVFICSSFVLMRRTTAVDPALETFAKEVMKTLSAKDYAAYRKLVLSKEEALMLIQSSAYFKKLDEGEKEEQYKAVFEMMDETSIRDYFDRALTNGENVGVVWEKAVYQSCKPTEHADGEVPYWALDISFSYQGKTYAVSFFSVLMLKSGWKASPSFSWGSQDEIFAAVRRQQEHMRDSVNMTYGKQEQQLQLLKATEKPVLDAIAQKQVEALIHKDVKAFGTLLLSVDDVVGILQQEGDYFSKLPDAEKKEVLANVKAELDSLNTHWKDSFEKAIRKAEADGIKWKKVQLDSVSQDVFTEPGSTLTKATMEISIRYKNKTYLVSSPMLLKCKSGWKLEGNVSWEGSMETVRAARLKEQALADSLSKTYSKEMIGMPVEGAPDTLHR